MKRIARMKPNGHAGAHTCASYNARPSMHTLIKNKKIKAARVRDLIITNVLVFLCNYSSLGPNGIAPSAVLTVHWTSGVGQQQHFVWISVNDAGLWSGCG